MNPESSPPPATDAEVESQIDKNWQYIYDTVKKIQIDMKGSEINTTEELSKKYNEFEKRYPKSWKSVIDGTFSLIEFKKMKETYSNVYSRKQGDHFDKKKMGQVAMTSQLAKERKIYKGKEPTSKDLQKAYEEVSKKSEIAKTNTKRT